MNKTSSNIIEGIKSVGGSILGFAIMIGFVFLAIVLLKGGISLADKIFPYIVKISNWVTLFLILVLIPMAYFKKSRMYAGMGLFFTSYFFGFSMWIYSALVAYIFWGFFALIIGLFLAGIGVLPIAILAAIFNGEWSIFGNLIYMMALTYGARIIGTKIMEKAEEESYQEVPEKIESGVSQYEEVISDAEIIGDEQEDYKKYCSNCGNEISSLGNFCKFCGKNLR